MQLSRNFINNEERGKGVIEFAYTLLLIIQIHKNFLYEHTPESSDKGKGPFRRANRLFVENKLLLLFPRAWHVDLVIYVQRRPGLNGICVAKDNTGRKISLSKNHAVPFAI